MSKIICPACGAVFEPENTQYSEILAQVRNDEFDAAVDRETRLIRDQLSVKHESEMSALRLKMQTDSQAELSRLSTVYLAKERELNQAVLAAQGDAARARDAANANIAEARSKLNEATIEIARLNGELRTADASLKAAVSEALTAQRDKYDEEARRLRMEVEYLRDMKARQSTKMVGESLEQHCMIEFDRIRDFLPQNVTFEKDNTPSIASGSKGDFIYRESTVSGIPILSIMFEMKNEMDDTAKKQKNSRFFAELDKDRREKNCEYAVLVSLLEEDNEHYNKGIVPVCEYPKMYVVRPQFFLAIISVLRGAALNTIQLQQELQRVRDRDVDLDRLDETLAGVRSEIIGSTGKSIEELDTSLTRIDEAIKKLQTARDAVAQARRHIEYAAKTSERVCVNKPVGLADYGSME